MDSHSQFCNKNKSFFWIRQSSFTEDILVVQHHNTFNFFGPAYVGHLFDHLLWFLFQSVVTHNKLLYTLKTTVSWTCTCFKIWFIVLRPSPIKGVITASHSVERVYGLNIPSHFDLAEVGIEPGVAQWQSSSLPSELYDLISFKNIGPRLSWKRQSVWGGECY